MTAKITAIRSEPHPTIGTIILRDAATLVSRWTERAKVEQPTAKRVHQEVLLDHMPVFLWELGRSLVESSQEVPESTARAAQIHGDQRWESGWSVSEVVRDYQILRIVLVEHLELALDRPLGSRESMVLAVAIDEAISTSVTAFAASQVEAAEQRRSPSSAEASVGDLLNILGILGHELRNPLGPLGNGLQILKVAVQNPERLEKTRLLMERQFRVMTRLVEDLMDVPRLVRGKLSLKREQIDLRELLRECAEDRRTALTGSGIRLLVELPDGPVWTSADFTRLSQAIGNLLTNAQKFTDHGGVVLVRLRADKGRRVATISIRDSGIGIEPDFLPKVFETFIQADRSVNRSRGGLGLGLALVKGIVELHGGTVRAASDGLGHGAEFTVEVPLIELASNSEVFPDVEKSHSIPRRILVIEDNHDSAESLRMYLEMLGHDVTVAHSGPDGIDAASLTSPEIIVCDIGLPGIDGVEVCRLLRSNSKLANSMIVALTGHGAGDNYERVVEAGFDAVLLKPVDPAQVAQLASRFLVRDPVNES